METNRTAKELTDLERAEAAPYLSQAPTPGWFFPGFGLWWAAWVVLSAPSLSPNYSASAQPISSGLRVGALVVLAALLGAFWAWTARRNGAMPTFRRPVPPEIARELWIYLVVAVVIVAAVITAILLLPVWAAAAVAFVLTAGGIWVYDRRYAAAADAVRERLA